MAKKVLQEEEIAEVKDFYKEEDKPMTEKEIIVQNDKDVRAKFDELIAELKKAEQFRLKAIKPYRHLYAIRKQVERMRMTHIKTSR